jgi:hypothetical protein
MSKTTSPVFPEIAPSDVEAVRRFLNADRDEPRRPRPSDIVRERKGPTVSHGITRARCRPDAKTAG